MANNNLVELGVWKGDQFAYDKSSKKVLVKTQYGYEPTVGVFAQSELKTHFAEKIASIDVTGGTDATSTTAIKLNIAKSSVKSSTLRYPGDMLYSESDYVMFTFYNYAPPFGSSGSITKTATERSTGPAGYVNYAASNDRSYANPSDLNSIILYMPEDVQAEFGAGWNGAGFGAAAAGALNLTGALGGGQDILSKLQSFGPSVLGGGKAVVFDQVVKQINERIGASITTNQAIGGVTGTILNPNVELMYEAPKLRNFNLKFKLVPRTQPESEQIKKICNTFKKSMLPSFGGSALFGLAQSPNLISVPNLCQVSFMFGNQIHPYLPKFKLCGITNVSINYTASGSYAAFADGAPAATELNVSFLESKLIFSDEVLENGTGI